MLFTLAEYAADTCHGPFHETYVEVQERCCNGHRESNRKRIASDLSVSFSIVYRLADDRIFTHSFCPIRGINKLVRFWLGSLTVT